MDRHPICGKMDTQKQLNVPLHVAIDVLTEHSIVPPDSLESGKASGVAFCRKIDFVVENFH